MTKPLWRCFCGHMCADVEAMRIHMDIHNEEDVLPPGWKRAPSHFGVEWWFEFEGEKCAARVHFQAANTLVRYVVFAGRDEPVGYARRELAFEKAEERTRQWHSENKA